MVNTILARRVNHIVAKGDSPAWQKVSKSRGFSICEPTQEEQIKIAALLQLIDERISTQNKIIEEYD